MARPAGLLLLLLITALVLPSAAPADETPTPVSHLVPYNLDWIAYIDPADAPPVRYAVCIVDTGVNITPDTPPDDPVNGPILKRTATDGGPGTQQGGSDPALLHGTRMAFASIAPQNGWGTVGVWPFGTAISVRATINNETSLRPSAYLAGLSACTSYAYRYPVAATLWALSCPTCTYTDEQRRLANESVRQARSAGMSVVAAAGSADGEPEGPASLESVLEIAAGSTSGAPCANSAVAEGIFVAPACPADSADPLTGVPLTFADGGTSTAAAEVASLIALVRSYRAGATHEQIETWLHESSRSVSGVRIIDGEAIARAAGLGSLVDRARRRQSMSSISAPAAPPNAPSVGDASVGAGNAIEAPNPLSIRYRARHLRIHLAAWDPRLLLELRKPRGLPAVFRVRASRTIAWVRTRPPRAILLRFVLDGSPHQHSRWVRFIRSGNSPRYLRAP